MTLSDAMPTENELERLFVNNAELSRVDAYLNRFNPIRTMRMAEMEIRHSAILAWLLDPRETDGLGDRFLRGFLCEAMRDRSALGSPTALEIAQADLRDAEVRREWQNIDIFVLLPRLNWSFIVENKFNSRQHEGQLSKYADRVKSIFHSDGEDLKVRGIFLTLLDEDPEDESYAPIRYFAICEVLSRLISDRANVLRDDVTFFLKHYLEVIMEASGVSEERNEMEALARQLYRSHKQVLDFVVEHGAITDFVIALEAIFGEGPVSRHTVSVDHRKLRFNAHNNVQVSFLPAGWVEALGGEKTSWAGCGSWWAGFPLICWFQLFDGGDAKSGQLRLFAEVGPIEDHDFRKALIASIEGVAQQDASGRIRFQRGASGEGKRYSKFLKENSLGINDIQNAEEIEKAMRLLLKKFQPIFNSVENILPQFARYGVVPT